MVLNRQDVFRLTFLVWFRVPLVHIQFLVVNRCKLASSLRQKYVFSFAETVATEGEKQESEIIAMNKELTFGAGLGIGTIVMYLLDPDRGKRRRALMRDKFLWAQRKTGDCIEVTARDLSNRARGIATTIQARFTTHEVDDGVLTDRVRSKLGSEISITRFGPQE